MTALSPAAISHAAFTELLSKYPAVLDAASASSSSSARSRPGHDKTLRELDHFRYVEAPALFSGPQPERSMTHADVQALVEWKLRHGKFRPTLMSLVSSNPPAVVRQAIERAIAAYHASREAPAALDVLTTLKGIGPATASLLLAVHDPARVIFFSDEAFFWLCCGGRKGPIRYSAKEYLALRSAARALADRLGVPALDIEMVAYVVMRGPGRMDETAGRAVRGGSAEAPAPPRPKRKASQPRSPGRQHVPVRRSKRTKVAGHS